MNWREVARRCDLPRLEDVTQWMRDAQEAQEELAEVLRAEHDARKEQHGTFAR